MNPLISCQKTCYTHQYAALIKIPLEVSGPVEYQKIECGKKVEMFASKMKTKRIAIHSGTVNIRENCIVAFEEMDLASQKICGCVCHW
jgi:hypothetical protein